MGNSKIQNTCNAHCFTRFTCSHRSLKFRCPRFFASVMTLLYRQAHTYTVSYYKYHTIVFRAFIFHCSERVHACKLSDPDYYERTIGDIWQFFVRKIKVYPK